MAHRFKVDSIVAKAIQEFSGEHPNAAVGKAAKALLINHAHKHQAVVASELREHTKTQRDYVNSLKEVLGYAADLSQGVARVAYKRDSLRVAPRTARVLVSDKEGGRQWLASSGAPVQIQVTNLRIAMKKKCKTFPWC
jgi:hypothetical protein